VEQISAFFIGSAEIVTQYLKASFRYGYKRRIFEGTEVMIGFGAARADTVVDVTNDRVELSATGWMMDHAESIKDQLILRAASYNPTATPPVGVCLKKARRKAISSVHCRKKMITKTTPITLAMMKAARGFLMSRGPLAWAAHMISPSTYDEQDLLECNVGVIAHSLRRSGCVNCAVQSHPADQKNGPTAVKQWGQFGQGGN
jgi:hypothetical protein